MLNGNQPLIGQAAILGLLRKETRVFDIARHHFKVLLSVIESYPLSIIIADCYLQIVPRFSSVAADWDDKAIV